MNVSLGRRLLDVGKTSLYVPMYFLKVCIVYQCSVGGFTSSLFRETVVVENGLFLFSREKLGMKRGKPIGFLSNELFLYFHSFQNNQRTFVGMEPKKSRGLEFGPQNASIHRRISRDG